MGQFRIIELEAYDIRQEFNSCLWDFGMYTKEGLKWSDEKETRVNTTHMYENSNNFSHLFN